MTLCTDEFAHAAQSAAASLGLPGLPLVVVAHPLANIPAPQAAARGAGVVDEVVAALTSPAGSLDALHRAKQYPRRRRACPR